MKKITNNSLWSKVSMCLNVFVLLLFILTCVSILKFDKVNRELVANKPTYDAGLEHLQEIEHPRKQALAEVDFYKVKLDTLNAKKVVGKEDKAHQEEIDRTQKTLSDKEAILASVDSTINAENMLFEPIKTVYNDFSVQAEDKKGTVNVFQILLIIIIIVKIAFFAVWNNKNLHNLHRISPWMNKGTKPYWAYVGWIIPVYNFIKPYSVLKETWNESEYALTNKAIVPQDKFSQNNEFNIGIWWALLLISFLLVPIMLHSAFFTISALFFKVSPIGIIVCSIIIWALYLGMESILIIRYNKINKMLVENENNL